MLVEVSATITTIADETAESFLGSRLTGRVHAIKYVAGTLAATTDLTITGETTGVAILTDSPSTDEWFYPRAFPNQATDGAAETGAECDICVYRERIKVAVAQGGAVGSAGTITAYVDVEN